jgi:hypothetical protein
MHGFMLNLQSAGARKRNIEVDYVLVNCVFFGFVKYNLAQPTLESGAGIHTPFI